MRKRGVRLDRIGGDGKGDGSPVRWLDALCLFWKQHRRLPNAYELASEMSDEWDDPCSVDEAQRVLEEIA
jgi:hypothetical protein